MKIARSAEDAIKAIKVLNRELPSSAELAARLGQAHAYYILNENSQMPEFGFSKFVGYRDLNAKSYLENSKELTGINTEHALSEWFEEVRNGTPQYDRLFKKLTEWMGNYGKRPRQGASQKVRLMILKSEFRPSTQLPADEDKNLLKLLIAVADRLPPHLRHELRGAL